MILERLIKGTRVKVAESFNESGCVVFKDLVGSVTQIESVGDTLKYRVRFGDPVFNVFFKNNEFWFDHKDIVPVV